MPCPNSCVLTDIVSSQNCATKGGLKCIYWNTRENIDWTAQALPANTDVDQCIQNYAMTADADPWYKIEFKRKTSSYTMTYNRENGYYEYSINIEIDSQTKETRNALTAAKGCCNLVMQIYDNNCQSRFVGSDYSDGVYALPIDNFRIGEIIDRSGEFGGDSPGNVLTFTGEFECSAQYTAIDQATFEATYT